MNNSDPDLDPRFLGSTPVIDWRFPAVHALASQLADVSPTATACRAFEWVLDRIRHSADARDDVLTCSASQVLRHGTGLCYAKSHLLVALLRANGIPAGLCYQRIRSQDGSFALHGLAACRLPVVGWYRMDARGNKPGIHARFDPPPEHLPFACTAPGEWDSPVVHAAPLPLVVEALRRHGTPSELLAGPPDLDRPPSRADDVCRTDTPAS